MNISIVYPFNWINLIEYHTNKFMNVANIMLSKIENEVYVALRFYLHKVEKNINQYYALLSYTFPCRSINAWGSLILPFYDYSFPHPVLNIW